MFRASAGPATVKEANARQLGLRPGRGFLVAARPFDEELRTARDVPSGLARSVGPADLEQIDLRGAVPSPKVSGFSAPNRYDGSPRDLTGISRR